METLIEAIERLSMKGEVNKQSSSPRFWWAASGDRKRLIVAGVWSMDVYIDFDDVNHDAVKRDANKLLQILEKHWPEPTPVNE